MGKLCIPVERKINGPWFLGITELEELNQICENIDEELTKSFEDDLIEEANSDVKKGYSEEVGGSCIQIKEKLWNT